jgi:uncharacterized repeat protein (TIGR01451 family)
MKKIYFLLLLCSVTAMAASPIIQNPTPLSLCDDNYDGFTEFDLTVKNPEILGSLNPSLYWVDYYETLTDAQNNVNDVTQWFYTNNVPNSQIVYARVWEVGNPTNFATTSLQLIVNPLPTAGDAPDMVVYESSSDGIAQFNLADNDAIILDGQSGMNIMHYETQANAEAGANPIAPGVFLNISNPQTIWVTVQNLSTGCYQITHFNLAVVETGNIYFPDPNFKAQIIAIGTDTNTDGEIQQSEADAVTAIYADNLGITDVTGVRSFSNLQTLKFRDNQVSGILDVSGMSNLTYLDFVNNNITDVNLNGVNNLITLIGASNNLTSLDFTGVADTLQELKISYNEFHTLDLSTLTHLTVVECYYNNMISLTVGNLPVLETLYCLNNHISTLDLSGAIGLKYFEGAANNLTTLDLSGLPELVGVALSYNNLTSINFGGNTHLSDLTCSNNSLTTLDFSSLPALNYLNCSNNQLTTLDLSNNHNFQYLNCFSNQLVTLFLKNGRVEDFDASNWIENPTLQYICADESQIDNIQAAAGAGVSVNSYCSFSPGGDHNTITGTVHFDGNNDGCDAFDFTPPFIKIDINDGSATGSTFTTADSSYTFYTGAGNYTITPNLENPSFFNVGGPLVVNFPIVDNSISNQHFCITANGVHPDLEIVIAPIVPARPGFEATYEIVFRNIGNQTISQLNGIGLSYDAAKLDFLSSDVTPSSIGSGTLNWDFANLAPFESRRIYVIMQVHSPSDLSNPVTIGDVLTFNTIINPIAGDENPSDNNFQFNQTVVGSFDPNEIVCLEGNIVSPVEIGNYLHYEINFENTGTADAENIVVRDVIDTTQFDINSLQLLNSSASVTTHQTGNVVEFIFPNINLHSGGHGNILLKVRSNNTLTEGDTVSKRANIYFDYNLPVETLPENTVFQSLSNPDVEVDASISVYPNPTRGNVNISCNNNIKSVQLYDIQGRLLQTNLIDKNETTIDISNQSNGIYFLKIISDKGMGVKKIVRD